MSNARPLQWCHYDFKAMGSPCSISLYAPDAQQGANTIQQAVADIVRLENKFSRYQKNNPLFHVNQAAANGASIAIDDEFRSLLNYADTCYQQSNGLFDITAGALRHVWDFSSTNLPQQSDIEHALENVGWTSVTVENNQLSFGKPHMEIDFGGIVKEYAADSAANICLAQGTRHGIVNLGGDIKAIGPHPDGKPWHVNIRDPEHPGKHMGSLELINEGIATSGNYERFIDINGKRYCHILSPKTGWPVTGLSSVTVKASQCVIAGSACTIAMLMEDKGPDWLRNLGVEFLHQ
ncbi:thiamine biosynthesis protein ApbE [Gammaproteobacteria bacterium 45_16_T64]|mgnify:CR=1 FL=1|nr:thiamine biosynthesis protein ApbE [Gammaproteobacteria bacterium 45_16_T64]